MNIIFFSQLLSPKNHQNQNDFLCDLGIWCREL
jgi:hypothetical protein